MDFILGYLAGWNVAAIIFLVLGLALVILEMFTPGFGIFGISGIISLIVSIYLSCVNTDNPVVYAMITLVLVVLLLILSGTIVFKMFKKGTAPIVLNETITARSSGEDAERFAALIGRSGCCVTFLRPSGKVKIDGELYDVTTDGEFINKDETVVVKEVKGLRIVVKRAEENPKV